MKEQKNNKYEVGAIVVVCKSTLSFLEKESIMTNIRDYLYSYNLYVVHTSFLGLLYRCTVGNFPGFVHEVSYNWQRLNYDYIEEWKDSNDEKYLIFKIKFDGRNKNFENLKDLDLKESFKLEEQNILRLDIYKSGEDWVECMDC